jgi:hypothetical protein
MQRKRLVKSALMLAAFSGLLLTQGCDDEEEDFLISPWRSVRATFVTSGNANAPANAGGQAGSSPTQTQSPSGVARTGITGNQISGGAGVP